MVNAAPVFKLALKLHEPTVAELKKKEVMLLPVLLIVNGTFPPLHETPPPTIVRLWKTPVVGDVIDQVPDRTDNWLQLGFVSPTPPEIDPLRDEVVRACKVQPQAQLVLP